MEEENLRNPEEISYWKKIFAAIFALTVVAVFVFGWENPALAPPGGAGVIVRDPATGNIGIGISTPQSALSVLGNAAFGKTFQNSIAPDNSLIVGANQENTELKVGIGTAAPKSALSVKGGVAVGYQNSTAPQGSLIVEGKLSTGRADPNNPIVARLDLVGGLRIGGAAQVGAWQARNALAQNIITLLDYYAFSSCSPSPCITDMGQYSALTINPGGIPVVAYYDAENKDLKLTVGANRSVIDSAGDVGEYVSIAIGSDGFPVMAYYDATNNRLKVAKCNNASCSSPSPIGIPGSGGKYTSIAIQRNGNPVIAFQGSENNMLRFAFCNDISCSNPTIQSFGTYYPFLSPFTSISLAIADDGFPIAVTGVDVNSIGWLYVTKCLTSSCLGSEATHNIDYTIEAIDSPDTRAATPALTIGKDGFPLIAYYVDLDGAAGSNSSGSLKIYKCGTSTCELNALSPSLISLADFGGSSGWSVGQYPSIAIAPDGNPVIAYYVSELSYPSNVVLQTYLRILKCGKPDCSKFSANVRDADNIITAVDGGDFLALDAGRRPSIAIGADGLPVVSYYSKNNNPQGGEPSRDGRLKLFKCGSDVCVNNWTRR